MITDNARRRLSNWFLQWRLPLRRFLTGKAGIRVADVDDVAQEVFLRIMRYERHELIEHPRAYLYKIASNVAAEWAIRAGGHRNVEEDSLLNLPGGEEPELELERAQQRAEMTRALDTLPPRQQQALKLYFTEELSHKAIAERTGQTLRTVRRHIARGYISLRRELKPELLKIEESGAMTHGRE